MSERIDLGVAPTPQDMPLRRHPPVWGLVAGAAILALAACAEPNPGPIGETGGRQDAGSDAALDQGQGGPEDTGGGGRPDLRPEPDLGLVGFLEPCDENGDCLSGYCGTSDDGRVCTRTCNDDCPPGWDCLEVVNEGGDVVFICMPQRVLCTPCEDSLDCGDGANACLAIGDGTFCGRECSDDDCPAGYLCEAVDGEDDLRQCVPEDGWCTPCRDEDRDAHRGGPECPESLDCDDEDPAVYRGAEELCDGKDNDCDSETDEDFDLSTDPEHCGSCERACAFERAHAVCQQGECALGDCEQGWLNCNEDPDDGCEQPCQQTHNGEEVCDGLDNDCNCSVDEGFDTTTDALHCGRCDNACPVAMCGQEGEGFAAYGASTCADSRCSEPDRIECGPYTCVGGGAQGDVCARACEDDSRCVLAAHCEQGECVPDRPNGAPCVEDHQCAAGHCGNGFCCAAGDCCAQHADCPAEVYSAPPECTLPTACQGGRVDATCTPDSQCVALQVDDDSACGPELVSDDCGAFLAVLCTGALEQEDPLCPALCVDDGDCDPGAHCDEGTCRGDLPDGQLCDEDSDCIAGHCGNGFCCEDVLGEGRTECCGVVQDCPQEFSQESTCGARSTCQGSRRDATCEEHICDTTEPIDDDRGCGAGLESDGCGRYLSVFCTGAEEQEDPACHNRCDDDPGCDPDAHCDDGSCQPDWPDGHACDEDSDCISAYCGNGFCCRAGDCCGVAGDCPPAYSLAPRCDQPSSCQGTRVDPVCGPDQRCSSEEVDDDSACTPDVLSDRCGAAQDLFCTGELAQQDPLCPGDCASDDECDPSAHCDGSCQPDLMDGRPCDEDSDCISLHCGNGFCCARGDCCAAAGNCPADYTRAPSCDDPASCQGTRQDATCSDSICGTGDPINDDRGCGPRLQSDACGLYLPVFCDGGDDQDDPDCPRACAGDEECDAGAHCDDTCMPDLADGLACDEASDCESGHCGNGFCCRAGDCCGGPADCPEGYTQAAACDRPSACQGSRVDAVCREDSRCASETVDDDSACTPDVLSDRCGLFVDLYCSGQPNQDDPPCPGACQQDGDCEAGAHCDGTCRPDLDDGDPCDEDSDCVSDHCANRFCCSDGDCCQVAGDCPGEYWEDPRCVDQASCQGVRRDALCTDNRCVASDALDDDRGCGRGLLANECGFYPSVTCSGAADQAPPQCPQACVLDGDCDPGAHCDGDRCVPNVGAGEPCDEPSDCAGGLLCVDGVCCTSACNGRCQRCDLAGDGTCTPVPGGEDPDGECDGLDCGDYYWGWEGDLCFERADLADADVACDGRGACETAAALCPAQEDRSEPAAIACHPTCQQPRADTCGDERAGACTDVNPGTISCGRGACRNTVPRCVNGAPNVCEPLPAQREVCNGVDDDCDGLVDAADPDLAVNDSPACEEQRGVCSGCTKPPQLCVAGRWQRCTAAEYEDCSANVYQTTETACDGVDNDCDGQRDEIVGWDEANCGSCGNVCSNAHGSTTCVNGECDPNCAGLWGDCDGDPDDGCETALTSTTNCGRCGQRCSLANGGQTCADGTCRLTSCSRGYANCDDVDSNGCETDLTPGGAGSTCATAVELDDMCGDREDGWFCPSNRVDGPSRDGRGERWYKVWVKECSDCPSDLQVNVSLAPPANMDYDLFLYRDCDADAVDSSRLGTGSVDSVSDSEGESWWGGNDSRWWYIKVEYWSGSACSNWTLDVCGGRGCP